MASQTGNSGKTLKHVIAALAIDFRPFCQQTLRAIQCGDGPRLCQGRHAAAVLRIDVAHRLNQRQWATAKPSRQPVIE